jgi:S1-C subfamily serine protease
VADKSAAATAGVRPGDVITAIDGKAVDSAGDLSNAEGLLPLGQPVKLALLRDGKQVKVDTRLTPEVIAQADGGDLDPRLDGAGLADIDQHDRSDGLFGVRVKSLADDSRAGRSGLEQGDLVIGVGRMRVKNLLGLRGLLAQQPERLVLTVVRDGQALYVPMQ